MKNWYNPLFTKRKHSPGFKKTLADEKNVEYSSRSQKFAGHVT